jgi:capsular polysaccharide biosynthesis protein
MELGHYARILWRSWPLVVGLPLLVAVLTIVLGLVLPQPYEITAAMLVTQRPIGTGVADIPLPDENNYYSWLASEYIVDDILQLVETRRFSDDIATWAQVERGLTLDPEDISDSLQAERRHRMIYLTVSDSEQDAARVMAEGAVTMLRENGLAYWGRQESAAIEVSLHELPDEAEPARGLIGLALDTILRTLLALILAVGLAFLRHYLDRSLRARGDVEALGMEVVGTIPVEGSTWWR